MSAYWCVDCVAYHHCNLHAVLADSQQISSDCWTKSDDLLRENAVLTASNARLREALKWFDDRIHVNPGGGVELCFNVTHGTMDDEETTQCKAALSALTELPAESLAAITAPLEAKMHDLSIALYTAIDSLESLGESRAELDDLRKTLNQTPEQSLAEIQDAARETKAPHLGEGALTRDLWWCECGRGRGIGENINLFDIHERFGYCPRCGAKLAWKSELIIGAIMGFIAWALYRCLIA